MIHRERNSIMSEDNNGCHIIVCNTNLLIGHKKHACPGEGKSAVRHRRIEYLTMFPFNFTEPPFEAGIVGWLRMGFRFCRQVKWGCHRRKSERCSASSEATQKTTTRSTLFEIKHKDILLKNK